MTNDQHKLFSPAAERNSGPIWEVLSSYLAEAYSPLLLEIASGSGQHAAAMVNRHAGLRWQPTDVSLSAIGSIAAYRQSLPDEAKDRLFPPEQLDVTGPLPAVLADRFSGDAPTHLFCANMIHIAPFACCIGLFATAAKLLAPEGKVLLYGPFFIEGITTAPTNLAFDQQLKSQSPDYGIRRLSDVCDCAAEHGFSLLADHTMPANNNIIVFSRRSTA